MRTTLLALLGVGVLSLGGYAAASTLDDTTPARTVSLPAATTGETTTGETTTGATTTNEADDVSGPCDEAEHADDPRCGGGVATGDDDGDDDHGDDDHGERGDDDDGNDDDEDRAGSNSGRG